MLLYYGAPPAPLPDAAQGIPRTPPRAFLKGPQGVSVDAPCHASKAAHTPSPAYPTAPRTGVPHRVPALAKEAYLMAWDSSDRRARLPNDWARRRLRVLRRDAYACQVRDASGLMCLERGNEVDHIVNNDDHDYSNLQTICRAHHAAKTQAEARAGRIAKGRRRPPSPHPGSLVL